MSESPKKKKRSKKSRLKPKPARKRSGLGRFFLRGLITVAPVLLTVVVFGLLYQMVNRYFTGPINSAIYWSLEGNSFGWQALSRLGIEPYDKAYLDPTLLPLDLQDVARTAPEGFSDPTFLNALRMHRHENETFLRDLEELCIHRARLRSEVQAHVHPLVGVIVSLLVVLWLGWMVGGFLGRRMVARLDQTMHLIPIVKSIYPYSKQLVEFFLAEKKLEFDTVVAVPYPSPGIWSLGFVTSNALKTLRAETGKDLVSVFVPSSPMPMTGYTVFIDAARLVPLPMSVDEALRVTMTGGVLVPPQEKPDEGTEIPEQLLKNTEDWEESA